ncbi:MAG: hypothetical protein AB7P31_05245 [Steroidobacteraceae bacterium]
MGAAPIDHARLMRVSGDRVEAAARHGTPQEQLVARRLVEDAGAWRTWEGEHGSLMRKVAAERAARQSRALKTTSFMLIERESLFGYVSARRLRGDARRQALVLFHGARAYTDAMVAEHGNFVRAACSHLCTCHIGTVELFDGAFQEPLARYEVLYREYFCAFCDVSLGVRRDVESLRALLPYLKHQVAELRRAILAMPRTLPELAREAELRRPTGDTVRLFRPH